MILENNIGWIKLHRKLLDWEWYDDINVKVLFIHLLLIANYTDKKWRGIALKKGSVITGISKLASETGLSSQKVRTALNKLELTNEITIKTSSKGSVIQLVMFKDYQYQQAEQQTDNKPITNEQQTSNKRATTIKEGNKVNKEKNIELIKLEFFNSSEVFFEQKARQNKTTIKKVKEFAEKFWTNNYEDEVDKSYNEIKKHFGNWIDKQDFTTPESNRIKAEDDVDISDIKVIVI